MQPTGATTSTCAGNLLAARRSAGCRCTLPAGRYTKKTHARHCTAAAAIYIAISIHAAMSRQATAGPEHEPDVHAAAHELLRTAFPSLLSAGSRSTQHVLSSPAKQPPNRAQASDGYPAATLQHPPTILQMPPPLNLTRLHEELAATHLTSSCLCSCDVACYLSAAAAAAQAALLSFLGRAGVLQPSGNAPVPGLQQAPLVGNTRALPAFRSAASLAPTSSLLALGL